jgi:hypothetical protein
LLRKWLQSHGEERKQIWRCIIGIKYGVLGLNGHRPWLEGLMVVVCGKILRMVVSGFLVLKRVWLVGESVFGLMCGVVRLP